MMTFIVCGLRGTREFCGAYSFGVTPETSSSVVFVVGVRDDVEIGNTSDEISDGNDA